MADTSIFVRNGLHSPIMAEESSHETPKKDEELSSAWRILKIVLFVVCLIVFVHQTVTVFGLYYAYPTTTRTEVRRPPAHFKAPAVTFCSDNPTKRSKFCDENKGLCGNAVQTPESCMNIKNLEIPNFGYCIEDPTGSTWEEMRKSLCSRNNTRLCKTDAASQSWTLSKNGNETELTTTFVEDPEWRTLLGCLSSHLHLNDRSEIDQWSVEAQSQGVVVDSYKITVDRKESFYPWKEPQIFLSIHSPLVPANPLLEGVPLKTGHSYIIHVRFEEEHLLPGPYQTNCTDYEGLWRKNNMTGWRSQEMCRDACAWFSTLNSTFKMVLPEHLSDAGIGYLQC